MTLRTTLFQKLGLIVGGILSALLLLELGLRGAGFILLFRHELASRSRREKNGEIRILCVGESTTEYGGSKAYPRQLEEVLNTLGAPRRFKVINKGRPGTNTSIIVNSLESWIEKHRPDAVVAMIGINDVGKIAVTPLPEEGSPCDRFVRNLRLYKLISLIREGALRRGGGPDADETTASLVKETEKNPRDATAFWKLGQALLEQEQFDRAWVAFQRAGELSPSAQAFFGLGMALKKSAKWDKAKSAFERCLALDPKNDRAWAESGECYLMRAGKNRAEAEKMFARALEANPDNDVGLAGMAYCLWKKEKYREAIQLGERAVASNPRNELAHEIIISCWKKRHDTPAAIRACERAIAHNPQAVLPNAELAKLYVKVGDAARAQESARRAREVGAGFYKPVTRRNYRRIREILDRRGVRLVAMQYPVRSVEPLKRLLEPNAGVAFVDNEGVFREALQRLPWDTIFIDRFGGDFGHCTPYGYRLIADNLARVLLAEVFPSPPGRVSPAVDP